MKTVIFEITQWPQGQSLDIVLNNDGASVSIAGVFGGGVGRTIKSFPVDLEQLKGLIEGLDEGHTPEPDPSYLIAKIQKLENSVKELDERLKKIEESAERQPREASKQNSNEVIEYELGLPQREKFERMKQDLRDWIEKNKIDKIKTWYYTDRGGRRGVMFVDQTNAGDNTLIIIGWPTIGLKDGALYTPDELLITGEAGKE